MQTIADTFDRFLEASGKVLAFTPLLLILVQFAIVLMVYVFAIGNVKLQESLQYINALMFLGGAGYTALHQGHVRVDLFYSKFSDKKKNIVDTFGTLFLLIPFLGLFWWASIPYIVDSWRFQEASVEASGLPFVYILKTTLLLFALSLSLHAISQLIKTIKSVRKQN
ncbi:TRAP transporter small permease subunit [Kordiimonas sp. SCSIO 12610]|uniref:TRAP transporter small permease subunit n=1 Tax=Kordiimonas sp. SCSIO 12610 TaxID=2829597 RepID=UPI00210B86BE|nr:TRAP transporter small permease subunit [Kordiimonas sp. SCSIO 12610]UTW56678.1 TRAP transporter small permease subunit [Kordiimonas sp. SCSIO 12610]